MSGVIVLNPGSATVKWARFPAFDSPHAVERGKEDIAALESIVEQLRAHHFVIRFVHGGDRFVAPSRLSRSLLGDLAAVSELAPLHNRKALLCAQTLLQRQPDASAIAVFDTQFFHHLPQVSQVYGLARELVKKYNLRRYGFHGFAHQSMHNAWTQLTKAPNARVVTIQLGSGCSMAAIRQGAPVDTTMGFTPNEGLLMSTRSGDIDPGLLTWLQRQENWTPEVTDHVLNRECGWFGVSGESANMADLLESGSDSARLAIELFCHRVRKTLGGYFAILGGLDGVVMSGGVAERAPALRRQLLENLEHLGIVLSNDDEPQRDDTMSAQYSPVRCLVVSANEERQMLQSIIEAGLT